MDTAALEARKDVLCTLRRRSARCGGDRPGEVAVRIDRQEERTSQRSWGMFSDGYARNLTDGILRLRYASRWISLCRRIPARYIDHDDAGVTRERFFSRAIASGWKSRAEFPRFDATPVPADG